MLRYHIFFSLSILVTFHNFRFWIFVGRVRKIAKSDY